MQISNALPSGRLPSASSVQGQDERQSKPDNARRTESPTRVSANGSSEIDQEELTRVGEAIQAARVQRLNDIESAPLKTQQALNSYQQTSSATQSESYGELVGIDLYV